MTSSVRSKRHAFAWPIVIAAGASMVLAACGSSSKTTSTPTTAVAPAGSATTSGGSNASAASETVSAANVPGVGTVLVNGSGRTLYVLATEKGGKITCTSAGGCTTIWPPMVLPSGMSHAIAGNGVKASLLGTAIGPAGDTRVTYGGWPLYTFSTDTGSGQAQGQGVKDAYGLWWAISPSGNPVTASSSTSSTTAPASGGAGF